jgi:TRAP-type mannitol/chloroaromatic compound transport system permease small subunit
MASALLGVCNVIDGFLSRVAHAAGWLFLLLAAVICLDVATRKLGFQMPGLGSTVLQELEWHVHTVIFSLAMGYVYVVNGHPRVDTATENMTLRGKAWMELLGCLIFAIPYFSVLVWFGLFFVNTSYQIGEGSDAVTGIPHRWILKAVFFTGIVFLLLSVLTTLTRLCVFLFGSAASSRANLSLTSKVDTV